MLLLPIELAVTGKAIAFCWHELCLAITCRSNCPSIFTVFITFSHGSGPQIKLLLRASVHYMAKLFRGRLYHYFSFNVLNRNIFANCEEPHTHAEHQLFLPASREPTRAD